MANIPFRQWTLTSFAGGVILVRQFPEYLTGSYILAILFLLWIQIFVFAIWRVILYPKYFSPICHLPSPTGGSYFMGHWKRILAEPTGQPAEDWVRTVPNNGLIRYTSLFNAERVLPTTAVGLREVLTTKSYEFVKPDTLRTGLGRLLGNGILIAEGDEHKMQRKNLMPAFQYRHIKNLYPVFWAKSSEFIEALTAEVLANPVPRKDTDEEKNGSSTSVIEVMSWFGRATLDIIGVAGLGHDFEAIKNPMTELNETYRKVFAPTREAQILSMLNVFLPGWLVKRIPMKRNDDIEEAAGIIRKVCQNLIQEKRVKMQNKEATDLDILSVAMESGGFSDENLIDQLMTFLAAGHETTATAMVWALYLLCLNPAVQSRLRAEIRSMLPSPSSSSITAQDIDSLPYLHAVCNEVLRFYPPVPTTVRETKDHHTTLLGHRMPKGIRVMLVPWAVNKDPALWGPDAGVFNPERWMLPGQANSGGADSNYSLLTFMHGPRGCIGEKFARAEFKCLLAVMIGRLECELADPNMELIIRGGATVKPAGGLKVRCKVACGW